MAQCRSNKKNQILKYILNKETPEEAFEPDTEEEALLELIARKVKSGYYGANVSDALIEQFITEYLTEHPIEAAEIANNLTTATTGKALDATQGKALKDLLDALSERIDNLPAGGGTGGANGKSAYEIAVENGFTGTEVEWLASLKGADGTDGVTPTLTVGTVTTLEAGSDATASIIGSGSNYTVNLGIPKGNKGDTGAAGTGSDIDLTPYQTITDNTLNTTDKTIAGAINEVKGIAETGVDEATVTNAVNAYMEANPVSATVGDKSITTPKIDDAAVTLSKLNPDIFGITYTIDKTGAFLSVKFTPLDSIDITKDLTLNFLCNTNLPAAARFLVTYVSSGASNSVVAFTTTVDKESGLYSYTSTTSLKGEVKEIGIYLNSSSSTANLFGEVSKIKLISDNKEIGLELVSDDSVVINKEINYEVASKKYVTGKIDTIMESIGGSSEEISMTVPSTTFVNFYAAPIVIAEKLPPCRITKAYKKKCKIVIFDSLGSESKIEQILSYDNAEAVDITVENGGYLGIIPLNSDDTLYKFSAGKRDDDLQPTLYYTFNYSPDTLVVGNTIFTTNAGTKYLDLDVRIIPLLIPTIESKIKDNKDLINQTRKELYSHTLSKTNPIRNIMPYLQYKNISLSGGQNVLNDIYQVFDEWKYKVIFSTNTLNSKVKIYTSGGEWEEGYVLLDFTTNKLDLYNNQGSSPDTLITSNDIPFTLAVDKKYILQITRDGLIMTTTLVDITSGEKFSCTGGKRLHGGLGVTFVSDETTALMSIDSLEWKLPLYNSPKALFIGDSITEGLSMGTEDISKRWASLLRDNYFEGNAIVCGRGWGTSSNALTILNKVLEYGYENIEYVFIMIGTNEAEDGSVTGWETNIVSIYDKIISIGAIPIIICPPSKKDAQDYITQMKDFILSEGWNTIRMDLATSLDGLGVEIDTSLSTDGTHFNETGNQKMYERALLDLDVII